MVPPGPILDLRRLGAAPSEMTAWLPRGRIVYAANGRTAITLALGALGIGKDGRALLPPYLCASAVAPFRQQGCRVEFYRLDAHLNPVLDDLCPRIRGADVVFLVHYFGFPAVGAETIARAANAEGVPLIEDCAHALFSRGPGGPLGNLGVAVVFSLRKCLALPMGGLLVWRGEGPPPNPPTGSFLRDLVGLAREFGFTLEHRVGLGIRARLLAKERVRGAFDRDGQSASPLRRMGPLSRRLLASTDPAPIVERRRANFAALLGHAPGLPGRPLYAELPDGACPVGFPLVMKGRDGAYRRCLARGVVPRLFWEVLPKEIPLDRFPESAELRDSLLVLPVHQDVGPPDLDRIVEALKS